MSTIDSSARSKPTREEPDLVVIGGGIYGLMIALEAGRAGLRPLVMERGTVGGGSSSNWFRILHGGLRYLQTLDIRRIRESAAEVRWFLRFAPDLVRPLCFLMPLYGRGIRRPAAFRAAFLVDALLAPKRHLPMMPDSVLLRNRVLDGSSVRGIYPDVRSEGLLGGALWSDAVANDAISLVTRVRDAAVRSGAVIMEGAEAVGLVVEQGAVAGVTASGGGGRLETWRAPVVINAAGPSSAELAERFDRPSPDLFRPSLAFNLLLDRPPLAEVGLALSPPGSNDPTLFMYPHQGRTFAGTWHTPWRRGAGEVVAPRAEVDSFLDALNAAAPSLGAGRQHVLQVFAGLLPAATQGGTGLAAREVILDHGTNGGPRGLFSVSGVKFTTSRRVAEKLVRQLKRGGHVGVRPQEKTA